ncbi:MAG: alcohol dehydrogenase catalytic domain-containing protein, partial [Planctomycetota bacterium]
MRAAIYRKFGGPISIESLPDPDPTADGVVIQVKASGLCRSDWHGWQGHDPDIVLPHVPGHELAGVVVDVGKDVRSWRKGDRVTLPFCCGCGSCGMCLAGQTQVCDAHFQPGFTAFGSFAELVAIPYADTNLVRLPDDMDFDVASILGCRFITAYRAVVDRGAVGPDEWSARSNRHWLCVFGCGGVGLSAVMVGQALGARIAAVDVSSEALQLARNLGAEVTINASDCNDVPTAVRDATGGGARVSIDALGHPECARDSILSLAKLGTHVQVGLLPGGATALPMDAVIGRELSIAGSHGMAVNRYPE